MKYRKLDDNLDYTLGQKPGDAFYADSEAVVQAIVTHLNLLLGEWWEDLDDGLPLFQEVLGQFNNQEDADLVITERILSTIGVKRVYDISSTLDHDRRKYAYTASVETVFGDSETFSLGFDGLHFYRI